MMVSFCGAKRDQNGAPFLTREEIIFFKQEKSAPLIFLFKENNFLYIISNFETEGGGLPPDCSFKN